MIPGYEFIAASHYFIHDINDIKLKQRDYQQEFWRMSENSKSKYEWNQYVAVLIESIAHFTCQQYLLDAQLYKNTEKHYEKWF